MPEIIRKDLNFLYKTVFFAGLTRHEYDKVKVDFQKDNRRVIVVLSMIASFAFFAVAILMYTMPQLNHKGNIYVIGALIEIVLFLLAHYPAKKNLNMVEPLRTVFSIMLYGIGCYSSLVLYKDQIGVLFIVFLTIVPLLFSERPIVSFIETVIVGVCYIIAAYVCKSSFLFRMELIDIVCFSITSLILNSLLIKIKAENHMLLYEVSVNEANILKQYEVISGIGHEYETIWYIDGKFLNMRLATKKGIIVLEDAVERAAELKDYNTTRNWYIDNFVYGPDKERVRRATEPDEIYKHIENEVYTVTFKRVTDKGLTNYHQLVYVKVSGEGRSANFVLGFRSVDEVISEEKKQRKLLEEALQAAEVASQAKTAFLSNMSHDIRTPMNAILGFTDILEQNIDDVEKRTTYINNIRTSSQHLLDLINEVLEMARIENGSVELDEEPVNLGEIFGEMETIFSQEVRKKNINYIVDIDTSVKYVYCDSIKLKKIFFNIVNNSIKYSTDGGDVKVSAREFKSDRPGFIGKEVIVEDHGIGMSKTFLPHIFDSFAREKTVTENKIVGTGLGMGIVKKLVELMGGTIEVESELGVGTRVIIKIEFRIASEIDLEMVDEDSVDVSAFRNKRLLVAEDNELNREIAEAILTQAGFEVEFAEDGVQCVDMVTSNEASYYDAVLMDIQMPNMDGLQATKIIRRIEDSEKSRIPIIAMTANVFDEDKQRCYEAGMDGFTGKPIDISNLYQELNRNMED